MNLIGALQRVCVCVPARPHVCVLIVIVLGESQKS